jgi:nifR3 family TIM-barrel protein
MAKAVEVLVPFRPFSIDINAGCPVPKVVKTGAGAALMKTPARFGKIVGAVVKAVERLRPAVNDSSVFAAVTVKIRSGWDAESRNYAECARIARDEGAAMITLHARTRAQGYGGTANRDDIACLTREMDIPVCGSGDLFTAADAKQMLAETGCAAVMFARGALGNPFIFEETRFLLEGRPGPPITPQKRTDTALSHLRALAAASGEEAACRAMRAHFCHYIKGIPNAAAIRNRIVKARTVREYEEALRLAACP